jgi:hypothetical protein
MEKGQGEGQVATNVQCCVLTVASVEILEVERRH